MKTWQTGGSNYYMIFNRGQHELREVTDEETGYYKIVTSGHFEHCEKFMDCIKYENIDYDNNF